MLILGVYNMYGFQKEVHAMHHTFAFDCYKSLDGSTFPINENGLIFSLYSLQIRYAFNSTKANKTDEKN